MSYDYDSVENSEECLDEVEEIEEVSEVERFKEEFLRENGGELPDLPGIEYILKIADQKIREREIGKAEMLKQEESRLNEDYESGKIDRAIFESKYLFEFIPKRVGSKLGAK